MVRHGVDLFQTNIGAGSVGEIPSGIIGIVGTAPGGPLNELTYIKNEKEAAVFGARVPGFSIPQAIAQIMAEAGSAGVVVLNVFDPAAHTTAVAAESLVLVNGKGKTAFPYVGTIAVKNAGATVTYVKGTDYSIDAYGNIASLNYALIAPGATLTLAYNKPNFAAVTSSVVIGTVDGTTGARTGFKALDNSYNELGLEPKILIAPGFSTTAAVVSEMMVQTKRLGAVAFIDAPAGTTVAAVKAGRNASGSINFNIVDKSIIPVFPDIKIYDPATDSVINAPLSSTAAGVMAATDRDYGYWSSPSNRQIKGISGTAVKIAGSAYNAGGDADELNSLGIVTVLNEGPSGFRLWGNRSSAWPTTTTPDNFYSVYRTAWIMGRSLQVTALQYVDRPITQVLIDQIRETGNGYIRQLIGRGGLLDGSECLFDAAGSDIAQGKLAYTLRIMPPVPAELIELTVAIDVSILNNLIAA